MKNDKIYDLVILNADAKKIHLGSSLSGSCNLRRMKDQSHYLRAVDDSEELESAVATAESDGYAKCGHCFSGVSLAEQIVKYL